jgi:hypothetical protein
MNIKNYLGATEATTPKQFLVTGIPNTVGTPDTFSSVLDGVMVTISNDWATGTPVRVFEDDTSQTPLPVGLVAGTTYFLNRTDVQTYGLFADVALTIPVTWTANAAGAWGVVLVARAFSVVPLWFREAQFIAVKTLGGTANTGNVRAGASATLNELPILMEPTDNWSIKAPLGCRYDFRDWYFSVATGGDGIVVIYS